MFATSTTQASTVPSLFSQTGSTFTAGQSLGATPSLGFGSATTTSTQSTGLIPSIGLSTPATTSGTGGLFGGLGTGFGGIQPSSTNLLFGGTSTTSLTTATTATTTTASTGLGGVDDLQAGLAGATPGTNKSDVKAVKENPLPNEIIATLDAFKKYVKDEKIIREEISRVSSKPILKVQEETVALKQLLSTISSGLQRNALTIEKLKQNSAEDLKHAEIAQRTKDTPPALQYENVAPAEYFQNLAISFERQMQGYRQQIEQLECHLLSLSHPAILTPEELTFTMRRLYETFVALAAQLQSVHEAVQYQKEEFLRLHKQMTGDATNVFDVRKVVPGHTRVPVTVGPDPFSNTPSAMAMASALNKSQQPSGVTGGHQSSFGVPSLTFGGGTSPFKPLGSFHSPEFGAGALGSSAGLGSSGNPFNTVPGQNKQFQLQKPPPGNKRGKRWTST